MPLPSCADKLPLHTGANVYLASVGLDGAVCDTIEQSYIPADGGGWTQRKGVRLLARSLGKAAYPSYDDYGDSSADALDTAVWCNVTLPADKPCESKGPCSETTAQQSGAKRSPSVASFPSQMVHTRRSWRPSASALRSSGAS
jgi:hypothetical protein